MIQELMIGRGWTAVTVFAALWCLEQIFPFKKWVDPRPRRYGTNFFIMGSNALILNVLLLGFVVSAYRGLELQRFGLLHWLGVNSVWNTAFSVILLDAATYFWHRAYHLVPVMWRMHRAHHSDRDFDVTTSGRFHLAEVVFSTLFRLGVVCALGLSLAGIILFEIAFSILNQLEHSNLRIPEPFETWMRSVFVTPDMHRIHHSRISREMHSNFGTVFSWWDRVFKSYRFGADQKSIVPGLSAYPNPEDVTLHKVLVMPLGPSCSSTDTNG